MTRILLEKGARIYVAGHGGLVGSALWRAFRERGFENLIGWRSTELDLRDRRATLDAICEAKPDVVVMAAARVGGILANATRPVDFLNDNLLIQTHIFEAAHAADVSRLIFLGSSCIYPKFAAQPISESSFLTGELEATNEAYAIAKISGIMAIRAYRAQYGRAWISAMPTNLYGPGDNFDLTSSHVLAALLRKYHEARERGTPVQLWGTGSPRREFLHVDDLAAAVLFLLEHYDSDVTINVGVGEDISIRSLSEMVADVVGYTGQTQWDASKPDGTPRKLLDVGRLRALGWEPSINLRDGIESTYRWYVTHQVT